MAARPDFTDAPPQDFTAVPPHGADRRRWLAGIGSGAVALATGLVSVRAVSQTHSPVLSPWRLPGLTGERDWTPDRTAEAARWLYLDFWASWCGPCRLSFPWMNTIHERWQEQGLRVVAVSVDRRREDALAFLKAQPVRFEIAFDPEGLLARPLAIRTMPTSLLVAPEGRIVHRHEGFTPASGVQAEAAIRAALQRQ